MLKYEGLVSHTWFLIWLPIDLYLLQMIAGAWPYSLDCFWYVAAANCACAVGEVKGYVMGVGVAGSVATSFHGRVASTWWEGGRTRLTPARSPMALFLAIEKYRPYLARIYHRKARQHLRFFLETVTRLFLVSRIGVSIVSIVLIVSNVSNVSNISKVLSLI